MTGKPKKPKFVATRTRRIIAVNIRRRIETRYRGYGDKFKQLAEDAGTSVSTVQRAADLEGGTGITVDVLTQLAMGLRCEPYELLLPPDVPSDD